ncbi:hypothetical protein F53441_1476 [Fusarium austroafricanum]|uniref:5',5'''-P-1,P-4-tetraphosphate phosphorylase 2 n=1 Tax=Fusarium austroafricanum TaxID=2364996 RepID=A0A8H4P515_9HYPO|nr:hypothetical protein F53441_1476 [Fusarium austroafricanum]
MPRIKAPSNLPELVKSTFAKARSESDLHYFPTQVTILSVDSIPFQLRFSPSLANKPKPPPKDLSKPQKPFDPFENPLPALKVTDLVPFHYLVLNKFAVVPEHFILATTEFKPQTHVLEESDLEATLACIEAYEAARRTDTEQGHRDGTLGGGDGLFAFFNCGDHSGASQPHRHIQLLPIARMKDGLEADTPWTVLADQLKTKIAPFATFAEDIKLGMSGADLHSIYLRLYRKACRAVAVHTKDPIHTEEAPTDGPTRISYNMAMTKDTLVVCPRLAEGVKLQGQDGDILGTLALNGTLLAGTALVKNELEWEALKKDPAALRNVLRDIGVPTVFENGETLHLCAIINGRIRKAHLLKDCGSTELRNSEGREQAPNCDDLLTMLIPARTPTMTAGMPMTAINGSFPKSDAIRSWSWTPMILVSERPPARRAS